MDSLPPQVLWTTIAICFVLAVITTMARASSIAVSDAWLRQTAEEGNKKAKRLLKQLEKSSSAVMDSLELFSLFLNVLIDVSSALLVFNTIAESSSYVKIHILYALAVTVILWFACSVLTILVPKRIAVKSPEKFSLSLSGCSLVITLIMKPFLAIFTAVAMVISRIFGVRNEDIGDEVTEEEIRMMVDIGSESGAIDDEEKKMIHNIFEMDDKPVDEIMTHRKDAVILWIEDSIEEWRKVIDETNHTRYPVCSESVDDVIGIVTSRDFYRLLLSDKTDRHSILRDAYFIPDTIKANELLSQMQSENEHMGVVMDEYGGFQGLVTQEDLIEEIVGELYSEYDEPDTIEEVNIKQLNDNQWVVQGSTEIEEVEEVLDIKIEDGDYNTFAGLVLSELQTIPADGEVFELETNRMKIKVTSVVNHRIEEALVTVLPKEDDEEDTEEK